MLNIPCFWSLFVVSVFASGCPKGFRYSYDTKSCYAFFSQRKTFDEAEKHCITNGGHLASISNALENSVISGLANTRQRHRTIFWIGGKATSNTDSNKEWTWTDNSDFIFSDFRYFNNGDCALVRGEQWRSGKCCRKLPFVCKVLTNQINCNADNTTSSETSASTATTTPTTTTTTQSTSTTTTKPTTTSTTTRATTTTTTTTKPTTTKPTTTTTTTKPTTTTTTPTTTTTTPTTTSTTTTTTTKPKTTKPTTTTTSTTTTTTTTKRPSCPSSWIFNEKFNNCYKVINDVSSIESSNACQKESATLASIHSEEENKFVAGLSRTKHGRRVTLIGYIRYEHKDMKWTWMDDSKVDYENWDSGEPIDKYLVDYAAIRVSKCHIPYCWQAVNITNIYTAVCKKKPT